MGRHNGRHIKIRTSGRKNVVKANVPKVRDMTVAEMAPRGPLALENQCVGILRETREGGVVIPDPGYPSAFGQVMIRKNMLNGAPFGMKVVCEISNPSASRANYEGRIIEVLGDPGSNDVEMLSVLRQFGLSPVFPVAVLEEAEKLPLNPSDAQIEDCLLHGRKDLRHLTTITIDGEEAKDLDDAISIEKLDKGYYRLWVHIADVSEYVTEGSALDMEASTRGTSVYLVDRVIPMLPPRLSNSLCSLNPHVPRLTMTCEMKIDPSGEIVDSQVYESLIESDARTSYNEINGILFEEKEIEDYRPLYPMFRQMLELKRILKDKRKKRGTIDFVFPETHVDLDDEGHPTDVHAYPINEIHGVIEEFMIAANEAIAERFAKMQYPFVYRIHEEPDEMKITEFLHVAKLFGENRHLNGKVTPKYLAELLADVADKEYAPALNQLLLRSMAKAVYSEEERGHFGLASTYYCHFTSPIRRYPDLYIHRIIKSYLHQQHKQQHFKNLVADVAYHSSEMERNSVEAERASVDLKCAEYMQSHLGEVFPGVVSGACPAGIFVQLENTIEGMVPFASLNEYFEYDERRLEARGSRGTVYRIGMKVQIQVAAVNPLVHHIDFAIVKDLDHIYVENKKDC
ncbi:MAG: ribonuclease R [Clostridiales bacterium]|nr:ribonuclease R [Candidatus Scatonaster coprocaballi]